MSPARREFHRLVAILSQHALSDDALAQWLESIKAEYYRRDQVVSDHLSEVEVGEMSNHLSDRSDEETLKFIQHLDELAKLNIRRAEVHADFIREQNRLLRAKIAERGLKADS